MTVREGVHMEGGNFAARDVRQGEQFAVFIGLVADEGRIPTQHDLLNVRRVEAALWNS